MAFIPMPYVFMQELDDDGNPLAGGKVYFYEAGTSTPKDTYTDSTGGTPNANPVILDADGRAEVWFGTGAYKAVIYDADDNLIDTRDVIPGAVNQVLGYTVEDKSSNFTLDVADENKHFNCTATLTIALPAAATAGDGFVFSVRNSSSSSVTIDPDGAELINGAASLVLNPNESALVLCDGSKWFALFIQQPTPHLDKAADYTVVLGDQGKMLLIDASGAAVTLTLPPIATTADGFELTIKKIDSSVNTVTLDAYSTEIIEEAETYVMYKENEAVKIKGDQVQWHILGRDETAPDVIAKTADYTAIIPDNGKTIDCDATSAAFTITLPAVATVPSGYKLTVKKTDSSANAVTIDGDGTETIDGVETFDLDIQYNSLTIITDGTEWFKVGQIEPLGLLNIQRFTASGTYTKTTGTKKIEVEVVAPGGGGGGPTGSGGVGGTSSFGSHCSATGGTGGGQQAATALGGTGGVGSNGDENITGHPGENTQGVFGGVGGSSTAGGGGYTNTATTGNYGGGGGGSDNGTNAGGGGGGGGTSRKYITTGIGATETVTIGAAGAAGSGSGGGVFSGPGGASRITVWEYA